MFGGNAKRDQVRQAITGAVKSAGVAAVATLLLGVATLALALVALAVVWGHRG